VLNPSRDRNENQAHQALLPLIKQEADRHGVLSFARFMELALYTPGLGFYQRSGTVIGRSGDFFTSVSVGRLFGDLIACQFASWFGKIPLKKPVIVECGAHDGQLANDILNGLESKWPRVLNAVEYWIVEPSETRRNWQQTTLKIHLDKIRWFHSWTELSSFCDSAGHPLTGIVFSNELLDAMPVHRLQWDRSSREWQELGVTCGGDGLGFELMPLSSEVRHCSATEKDIWPDANEPLLWPRIPEPLLDALPDGFITEICPDALDWWRSAAKTLETGWLITADYGLVAEEFFMPQRANGTLRAYRDHKLAEDLLADPGKQDITASVNFSAVERAGELAGLKTELLESQSKFLTTIMAELWPQETAPFTREQIRQFQTLTHPDHLGRAFKVLVQSCNVTEER
jgi:SAM-dependent MidA family methyltransferase